MSELITHHFSSSYCLGLLNFLLVFLLFPENCPIVYCEQSSKPKDEITEDDALTSIVSI